MTEYRTEIVDPLFPRLMGWDPSEIVIDLQEIKQRSHDRLMSGGINLIAYRESPDHEWQVYRD